MTAVAPVPQFTNRKGWLIFFGVGLIMIGIVCLGMAALVMVGSFLGPQTETGDDVPLRVMIPAALLYVAVGAMFIMLGAGSAMARRWAQAITLAISWMWLVTGLASVVMVFLVMPKTLDALPEDQAGMKAFVIGCVAIIFAVFFIALPGLLVLFYRGRNVRATVEALDPVPRWTDGIPIPLLVFVLWMFLAAAGVLMSSFMYQFVPFGDFLLTGPGAYAFMIVCAAILLFIAIGSMKRMKAAWWTALILFALGLVYGFMFLRNPDIESWYEAMGMPINPREVEMMQEIYSSPVFLAVTGLLWLGYFAYIFYLRRYFYGERA